MMYLCYFTMNLLRCFFASWLILMLVETVSSKEAVLRRLAYTGPLAVIKKQDSSLQLAIPHAHESESYLSSYNYDDSEDQNGPKEEFMIACPAHDEKQLEVETNWKTGVLATDETKLLFLSKYTDQEVSCSSEDFTPLINKVEDNSDEHVKHCNKLHADMYEVGYPVSNDEEGKDIQFLSTYKICYSKTKRKKATLYSIHRIKSPDLLFMDGIRELTDRQPLMPTYHYESVLDSNLSTKDEESFKDIFYYKYEFVGVYDMPNRLWRQTTFFLFNNITITRDRDLFRGMLRADWYIRLYSYKKNKQLNLYSGTHKKKDFLLKIPKSPPVESFWRVISDNDGNAIILVTQYSEKILCGEDYLCGKNRKVKTYEAGGCIYTCSLDANENLLQVLGSPSLKITGELDFTFQTEEPENMTEDGHEASNSNPSQTTGIIEFLDHRSLRDALLSIDMDIFRNGKF
ncbi:uncharacterized protein LOC135847829 isoform X2 [Planococcus citri]|uniref:uncharacterized protein LOC135847829 isoform X2 n=1 Tax=Planococcus citri TaxID=170843 RepID=UPI0031F838D7